MFEYLKKELLKNIKQEILDKQNEEKKLKELLIENKNKITFSHSLVITNNPKYIEYESKCSKLFKIFHKKKYKEELKKIYNEINEENIKNRKIAEDEKVKIESKLKEIEKNNKNNLDKINIISNAKDISDIPISFDEAKELFDKNGINIFDYDYSEIFKLGDSKQTTENIDFMKKSIKENPFNIIYDRTNNYDLYYDFIKDLNIQDSDNEKLFNSNKNEILEFLEKSKNNEIFINPIYIMEAIRFYFKDTIMYESGELFRGNQGNVIKAIACIKIVINKALEMSLNDYLKLESIYKPDDNNYYCHRTGSKGLEESIFKNGLKISSQGTSLNKTIVRNARKVDCFLAIVGYSNFYAGNGGGDSRIILEIPKDEIRPIGSNNNDGTNTFVLPQYVLASLQDVIYDNERKVELHINKHENMSQYKYLYKDGYNMSCPFPVEREDIEYEKYSK